MLRIPALNIIFCKDRYFLKKIWEITGYVPGDLSLYRIALTHKSASYTQDNQTINNERLEYLGDSILDAVVSDYLYKKYGNQKEGFLTEMRSKIVNGEKLKELAVKLGIADHIIERVNINIENSKLYEDAFEAFIGAVYLDKGFNKVYKFIKKRIIEQHIDIDELKKINNNYKSQLIEWSQKTKKNVEFSTKTANKESANKLFVSELILEGKRVGKGKGSTKKEAEQKAAYKSLIKLGEIEV